MKYTKMIAILLCTVMLLIAQTGCGDPAESDSFYWDQAGGPLSGDASETGGTGAPNETAISGGADPSDEAGDNGNLPGIDFKAALNAFPPDTVMVSAGEYSITWAELFFHMYGYVDYLQQMSGDGSIDWSEAISGEQTMADAVLNYAVENSTMFRALEYGAKLSGVELSQDELSKLQESYDMMLDAAGSEEALLKTLWEQNGCSSIELYNYVSRVSLLATVTFSRLYGEGGKLLSDEEASAYTAADGYMMAKHILRLKKEEGDNTPLEEIEAIKQQLDSFSGDDFETFFDELMSIHSEDNGGLEVFPDGYLFQYGDMVPEFYDACFMLETGDYSDIVETTYGYHIILRLPINYDVIPTYYYNQGETMTLRNIAAMGLFDTVLYGWMGTLTSEFTPEYEQIDLPSIFTVTNN